MEKFIKEFERIKTNPIYFIDNYYNLVSDEKLELSDDQKQALFDKYRKISIFKMDDNSYLDYEKRMAELKTQGYKDWEIL